MFISPFWGFKEDVMQYFAISEKGVRDHNEDHFIAERVDGLFVFGVADGIGGHAGGEFASKIAIVELKEAIKRKGEQGLKEGFKKANSTILSENERKQSNMGTTLVACVVKEETGEYIVANVGDSRAYLFGNKTLKTSDHSLVHELVKKGIMDNEEAAGHPQKNIVTRALGLEENVKVDIYNEIETTSSVLLCSDGLSDYVKDEEMAEIVKKNSPKVACKKLVKKAIDNKSKDNITIIVVNFRE